MALPPDLLHVYREAESRRRGNYLYRLDPSTQDETWDLCSTPLGDGNYRYDPSCEEDTRDLRSTPPAGDGTTNDDIYRACGKKSHGITQPVDLFEDDVERDESLTKTRRKSTVLIQQDAWARLPHLVLELIFRHLPRSSRASCARVCTPWGRALCAPGLWRHLLVSEGMFMQEQHINAEMENRLSGKFSAASHRKIQTCLGKIGTYIRSVTIRPIEHFHMLAKLLHIFGVYLGFFDDYPCPELVNFSLTFAAWETQDHGVNKLYGTGGQLLHDLRVLLTNARGLREVTLNNLLLSVEDGETLLPKLLISSRESLRRLELINLTKSPAPISQDVLSFANLHTLMISPTQLDEELLVQLACDTQLMELWLVQEKFTSSVAGVASMPRLTWQAARRARPRLRVRLVTRGACDDALCVQQDAPVDTVLHESPRRQVDVCELLSLADVYRTTLRVFGHSGLPRHGDARRFTERCDTSLVLLVRECPYMEQLIIRDRVSTCTLLVIALEAKHLKELHVRRNAVIKRFDWPRANNWTDTQYEWLRNCSRSYETTEKEISQRLKKRWHMLSDKSFKDLNIRCDHCS